jgi:hypothetical protein
LIKLRLKSCALSRFHVTFALILIKSLRISCVGLILFAATAWAAPSVLHGVVKDPNGRPVKGADIRIEAKDGSKLLKTVKTDIMFQTLCQ